MVGYENIMCIKYPYKGYYIVLLSHKLCVLDNKKSSKYGIHLVEDIAILSSRYSYSCKLSFFKVTMSGITYVHGTVSCVIGNLIMVCFCLSLIFRIEARRTNCTLIDVLYRSIFAGTSAVQLIFFHGCRMICYQQPGLQRIKTVTI